MIASLTTLLSVIATPIPTESDPPFAAPPSATDSASLFADDATDTVPPVELTVTPLGIVADEVALTRLTDTAAATLIGPDDDSASGASWLVPSPPFSEAWLLALSRSWFTSSLTPP